MVKKVEKGHYYLVISENEIALAFATASKEKGNFLCLLLPLHSNLTVKKEDQWGVQRNRRRPILIL